VGILRFVCEISGAPASVVGAMVESRRSDVHIDNGDGRLLEAAEPEPARVLAHAGHQVEVGRVDAHVAHQGAGVVVRLHPDGVLRFGCSRWEIRVT